MPAALRVALIQMKMVDDVSTNDAQAETKIREAAAAGAQLICLPELFRSPYFCQIEDVSLFDLGESIPGPSTQRYGALAKSLGVTLVTSLFERRAKGLYHNTTVVLGADGEILHRYRKMHIPDDPKYYEKFYFTPGDLGFSSVDIGGVRLGVLICWDQWFPEAARLTALSGADILIYPTAIGWHPQESSEAQRAQREGWQLIQRSHALANGCFVLSINRVGFEATRGGGGDGLQFWGTSFIASPDGMLVAEAGTSSETIVLHTLDLAHIERQRRGWPFLRDRRIDAYGAITRRFGSD